MSQEKAVIKKKEDLIQNPEDCHAHVVLLGAGASRAAFPNGDGSGESAPIMNDLVKILKLGQKLKNSAIDPETNFENIYSKIEDKDLKQNIEKAIYEYFENLSLPTTATHYDRLLLSLRQKDAIFTFNWDPFLFDAYQRNSHSSASLPEIFFLHGNVRIGSCRTCNNWGGRITSCSRCHHMFEEVPLLYPIREKDYFKSNQYTALSWENAKHWFAKAFTTTIFGYSAPTSDIEAIELLKTAWFNMSDRSFEHLEVIDIESPSTIHERWKEFVPTGHLQISSSFEDSRLWRWPRRSCESIFYPMSKGISCEDFPMSSTNSLVELQQAIEEIAKCEKDR